MLIPEAALMHFFYQTQPAIAAISDRRPRRTNLFPLPKERGTTNSASHDLGKIPRKQSQRDYGFAAESTFARLASFMAVQNTYLSTFQSLGALGLLLGTIGLAVVQLRSVLERRGELALMRAVGFRRRRLGEMLLLENAALLLGGLATGVIAALVAILPQLLAGGASTPWLTLAATLGIVLVVGLAAGLLAVRATTRAPHSSARLAR